MNEPIGQHLVPRCYLKHFALAKKKDWLIDACNLQVDDNVIFNVNIKAVCKQNEFYTFKKLPDEDKRFLEKYYSKTVEADYGQVYNILTNGIDISNNDRFKIIAFVICQYWRTAKYINALNDIFSRSLEHGHALIEAKGLRKEIHFDGGGVVSFENKTLGEVIKESKDETRERYNSDTYLRFKELTNRRINDRIVVYEAAQDDFFITSDNPVKCGKNIYDPTGIIKMPINQKYMVGLLPFNNDIAFRNKKLARIKLDEERSYFETSFNNIMQIEQADQVVLGSKANLTKAIYEFKTHDKLEFDRRFDIYYKTLEEEINELQK
ncbi:MAG TPA: DUF4238 domain-containing protein [Mucilaginibacter sp.]|jgi:hypothetical protein